MNPGLRLLLLLVLAMGPALVSGQISVRASTQGGASSGELLLPKPAGTSTGDVLVAAISVVPLAPATTPPAFTTPSGWTVLSDQATGAARLAVLARVVPAGDASVASYSFDFAAAHGGSAGGIVAFMGVDTTTPIDASAFEGTATGFVHAAPSLTTTVRGAQLVGAFTMPGATEDWLPPAGMAETVDVASVVLRPQASGVALSMTLESRMTTGATGTRSATASSSGLAAAAGRTGLVALRPALAPANTHYRLDGLAGSLTGSAGEVIDSGGTGLNGFRRTITAPTSTNLAAPNPTIASQFTAVSGSFCNAAEFDGRAVLQVPANALFDYAQEFSASVWIYPTAAPGAGGLYSVLSNDQNYEFHLDSNQRLFWWWGGGVRSLTSNAQIALNQWTHVAITFRSVAGSARQRIYINGVLDTATNSWEGTLTPSGCDFSIGGDVATGGGCGLIADRAFRGLIDEVKLYNDELTQVDVQRDMTIGRTCTTPLSRYRIEHDGSAVSCAAEAVTIRACASADCALLSSTGASGTLIAGGNSVPFSIPVGQTSTTVSILVPTTDGPPNPETVRLGIGSVTPTPSLLPSCSNGAGAIDATSACDISATDAGLAVEVPDHVSDTVVTGRIRAVRRDGGGACVPLFAGVTRSIGFWSTYDDPATGTRSVSLNGTPLGTASPGTSLDLPFDAQGEANVTLRYPDAGRVRLNARYSGTSANGDAGLVLAGDDPFVARPARFQLVLDPPHSATATATDATRLVFLAAGTPFSGTVTALNASGAATPNFGRESSPEGVRFDEVLLSPAGGISPDPVVVSGYAAFANGASSGSLRWDEVGVIRLRPRLSASPYLDFVDNGGVDGDVVGDDTGPVGRFAAARLAVSPNVPTLRAACPGASSGFTYVGQEFGYDQRPILTVSGLNAQGAVTRNYVHVVGAGAAGAFWRLPGSLANRQAVNTAATTATLSRTTDGGTAAVDRNTSAPADGGFDGEGRIDVTPIGDRFTYTRPAAPIPPFEPSFEFRVPAIDLTDSDGACHDPDADGVCDPLVVPVAAVPGLPQQQRWGRVVADNAFGPELIDLQVPMRAEFFDGSAFVLNADDGCTVLAPLALTDPVATDALVPTATCVQDSGSPGASGLGCGIPGPVGRRYAPMAVGGNWTLWLQAPGAGNVGVLDLTPPLPSWLQFNWTGAGPAPPTARVGFGVYQGDRRTIHTREVY